MKTKVPTLISNEFETALLHPEITSASTIAERVASLSEKSRAYYNMLRSQSGVLCLLGKPGIGKSAILRNIARTMGWHYLDLRLTQIDETDLGVWPRLTEYKGNSCFEHVIPKWAIEANEAPTLIHFEEFNRASLNIRNAAMQILLERTIGGNFAFNQNVYMVSSGNLGSEDDTSIEELDAAQRNRFIFHNHTLSVTEWVNDYAYDNIHPNIVEFVLLNEDSFYDYNPSDNVRSFATPRSWTFLSDAINTIFGKNCEAHIYADFIQTFGTNYIGKTASRFYKHITQNKNRIKPEDIINNFDNIKSKINDSRGMRSYYNLCLKNLFTQKVVDSNGKFISNGEYHINELKTIKLENIKKYFELLDIDEVTALIHHILRNTNNNSNNINERNITDNLKYLTSEPKYKEIIKIILSYLEGKTPKGN